jgi:hypothetical protein
MGFNPRKAAAGLMGLSNTIDKSGVSNPVDRGGVKISSQLVGGVRHNAPGLRPGSTGPSVQLQ